MIKWRNGFSLTEILLVIAIIIILSTTAISLYPYYETRTKISTELNTISPLKLEISEKISANSESVTNSTLGYIFSNTPSNVSVNNHGEITINIGNTANGTNIVKGEGLLKLTPSVTGSRIVSWTCSATGNSLNEHLLPNSCTYSS